MPSTDITIDPVLYQLFERIIREAPPATEYQVNRTGTRQDSSTFEYREQLGQTEKDKLPWGTHDAIIEANWWAPDDFGVPNKEHLRVFVDSRHNGVAVGTSLLGLGQHIVRINPQARTEMSPTASGEVIHYAKSEDEAVELMLGFIAWINQQPSSDKWDDDYDDRSRYDPLDEHNYPLHER